MTLKRVDPWLAAAVVLALVVRVWGLRFGLPHTLTRPDEDTVHSLALLFFSRHLNPHFFRYPSLLPYTIALLYVGFLNVGRLTGWFTSEFRFISYAAQWPLPFFVLQRSFVAMLGAASVLVVYSIARRVSDRTTARIAAFFLALAYLHVRDSHFGVTDVPMTFLVLCSAAFALRYTDTGRTRDIVFSSALAGLAASTKYNGVIILIAVASAIASRQARAARSERRRAIALAAGCVGVAAACFVVGTPFAALDPRAFWADFVAESAHLQEGHIPGMPTGWQYHLTTSLRYGLTLPLLVAGAIGCVLLVRRRRAADWVVLSFPLVYYLAIGYGRTAFVRYMVPVVPFLCIAAAASVTSGVAWASRAGLPHRARAAALVLLAALLVMPSAMSVARANMLLSQTDTRLLAARSIATRWPDGATMYQSGSIYAQVQFWPLPWGERYVQYRFDEATGQFSNGTRVRERPQVITLTTSPFAVYDPRASGLNELVAQHYSLVERITGLDPAAHAAPIYDVQDALYLPLARLDVVRRPGPTIEIYARHVVPATDKQ